MSKTLHLHNVRVYDARNDFWTGQTLTRISGESLYQDEATPWGFKIHLDADDTPVSVEFANGTLWSFCGMKNRCLEMEWPLFLKDNDVSRSVRVGNIYSDSMHLHMVSENACLNDILIWHYPPRGGKHGADSG
jgi:hypothetical protein